VKLPGPPYFQVSIVDTDRLVFEVGVDSWNCFEIDKFGVQNRPSMVCLYTFFEMEKKKVCPFLETHLLIGTAMLVSEGNRHPRFHWVAGCQ